VPFFFIYNLCASCIDRFILRLINDAVSSAVVLHVVERFGRMTMDAEQI
jgi:hypothetical protein